MILRVTLPGALYRLSLDACGGKNATLNTAICRLLEHPDWLEQTVDAIAEDAAAIRVERTT
jgi:hypothetical protein